jgi:hypothetical protein
MATTCRHFCFVELIYLGIYYIMGCGVGLGCIALTNSVAVDDLELAPYQYAWFSWGFVFWFLILFFWMVIRGK